MNTIAPIEALKKVASALGFEIQGNQIVHVETGKTLKGVWSPVETSEDLKAFKGLDAEQEMATLVMEEIWSLATTGNPKNCQVTP